VVPSRELRVLLGFEGCKAARAWLETQADFKTVTEKEIPLLMRHLCLQASTAREAERSSLLSTRSELQLLRDELRQAEQERFFAELDVATERREASDARDETHTALVEANEALQSSVEIKSE